jgi:uncharacterized protein YhfF
MSEMPSTAEAMWRDYRVAAGVDRHYSAWAFGADDTPALADDLARLVLTGRKTATSGLLDEPGNDDAAQPAVGDHSVILDAAGRPVCIIRTTAVEIRRFGDVDAEFAAAEGEGDRSLSYWRDAHIAFFGAIGVQVDDETPLVLEHFELVWPLRFAAETRPAPPDRIRRSRSR